MSDRQNPYVERDPSKLLVTATELMVAASKKSTFTPLCGQTNDDIIKTQSEKHAGANTVEMSMRALVRGNGVKGNSNLDSNRDDLNYLTMKVEGDVLANSIESKHYKITSASIAKNFRADAKDGLSDWLADRMDRIRFSKLSENCTNIVVVKANGQVVPASKIADSVDGLDKGDLFTTQTADEMLSRAENGYTDELGVRHPPIRPYKTETKTVKGVEQEVGYYIIYLGPESAKSITDDPIYLQWQDSLTKANKSDFYLNGLIGEYKNAIFVKKNAWSPEFAGILTSDIKSFEDYATGFEQYSGKGGIITEVNLLVGATAGMQPFQAIPDYIEDSTDSGRKMMSAIDLWFGFEKTKFMGKTEAEKKLLWHGKDYGVIAAPAVMEK